MASISNIGATNPFVNGGDGKVNKGDKLGKDEFLKLMIAQMQNQNPLEPQSDTDQIAQMAQFTSLEQMTNMSKTMLLNSAISLIGQSVEWKDEKGVYNMGVVNSAMLDSKGVIQVVVGDKPVDFDKVKVVTNDRASLAETNALIGREITWYDSKGVEQTGVVDSVSVVAGYPVLLVGKAVVDLNTIVAVKAPASV
ncbi:MAG: hypothetical protein LBR56_06195 [Sporomusaceae bacterium]|jgi:flagellar basal-body rod modification protein FlgD|nr:hypothetical protein [Sporomusaceae bacterium]